MTGKDDVYCIAEAHFTSSSGLVKSIRLLDAIAPLKANVRTNCTLLLSKEPIVKEWPLPVQDDGSPNKKKRKIDLSLQDSQLEDLRQFLDVDIPLALAQLAKKVQSSSWLTIESRDSCVVALPEEHSMLPWPELESAAHGDDYDDQADKKCSLDIMNHVNCKAEDLLHRLVSNSSNKIEEISLATHAIALPSRSAFLITDLLKSQMKEPAGWTHIMDHAAEHPPSLILLDPPYPNLSAGRLQKQTSRYRPVSDLYELWKLRDPVQQLLNSSRDGHEAIVGCWVTNYAKIQRFVLEKLFPAWGLQHIGQLVWIKVTAGDGDAHIGGELVYPLNNKQGRRPYEILFLGQRQTETIDRIETDLFASVPLDHSRKPYVVNLLRKYLHLNKPMNVYEFFARSICAGPQPDGHWISIGNEPVKFNQEGVSHVSSNQKKSLHDDC